MHLFFSPVSYVVLNDMLIRQNGDRAISLSGYNNTISNLSVYGNGCGGIAMSGGDQVLFSVHAPEGYVNHSVRVCVCLSVCYHISDNIVHVYVTTTIAISFTGYSLDFYKHDFL